MLRGDKARFFVAREFPLWKDQIEEKVNSLKTKKKLRALFTKCNTDIFFLLLKLYDPPIRRPEVKMASMRLP